MNRQRALYEYLENKGDTWTPQVQVARDLYEHFGNGECYFVPAEYHDSNERKILSQVISEINLSPDFEKIIISSGKGIKLANEQEHQRYVLGQYRSALRKLKRVCIMEKKGNLNNQIGIDGKAIEAFMRGI
jgi:hypothetical protein